MKISDIIGLDERLSMHSNPSGISDITYITKAFRNLSEALAIDICVWDDDPEAKGIHIEATTEEMESYYSLPDTLTTSNMLYGEFLFTLFTLLDTKSYFTHDKRIPIDRLSVDMYFFLSELRYGRTKNPLIKQLCNINYNALLKCVYDNYAYYYASTEDNTYLPTPAEAASLLRVIPKQDDTKTFGQVLISYYNRTQVSWSPHNPIEEYRDEMISTYYESFRAVFFPLFCGCGISYTMDEL